MPLPTPARARLLIVALLSVFIGLLARAPAEAHPHVFVDARSEVVFEPDGRVGAIRHVWRFDEGFSAYATQGLDANNDGHLSSDELAELAKINVESLREYRYFTFLTVNGRRHRFDPPKEYWLTYQDGYLTLFFTLPLKEPVTVAGQTVTLDVYDPEYFVAFKMVEQDPMTLVNAPAGCTLEIKRPADLDPMTAATLAIIPSSQRDLPENLRSVTQDLANTGTLSCPASGKTGLLLPPSGGGLVQVAAAGPFGIAPPEPSVGGSLDGPLGKMFAVVALYQQKFYLQLTTAVRALKDDPSGVLWLGLLSFLYGVFHAAGPGHGKAVIAGYLLTEDARIGRAISVSALSALIQALVAIGLVGVAGLALGLTGLAMSQATLWFETGSIGLVVLLGVVLVWRKIVMPVAGVVKARLARPVATSGLAFGPPGGGSALSGLTFAPPSGSATPVRPAAHSVHFDGCGCAPAGFAAAATTGGWRAGLATALAAGVRPCTGALVVLVFALSQGLFVAGVAAALMMSVGTAATVAVLALMAVGVKGVAGRLAGPEGTTAIVVHRVIEGIGALIVLLVGLTLLGAQFVPAAGGGTAFG
ncbi:DUF1007 family protein [Segnochrobactraceae bacterium EtOH-i3]